VTRRHPILVALFVAGAAGVAALEYRDATTPITPRPLLYLIADTQRELERLPLELTRVSEAEENRIGDEMEKLTRHLVSSQESDEAKQMAAYVRAVGERVAAQVKRRGIRYRFRFSDDRQFVNAFALPGGRIVFGRGLLELLESEDELAAILGHEIAHVDERHAIERVQYELRSRKIGLGGLYRLGRPVVALFQAGYTKEKELEADRRGLALAVAAGYSPAGAVSTMRRFGQFRQRARLPAASPLEELLQMPLQSLEEYFRSHPPAAERIAAFEKEIALRGWDAAQPQRPLAVRAIFLVERAGQLDARGYFEPAISLYKQALEIQADNVRALRGLAHAYYRSGDAANAAKAATEVVRRNPNEVFWGMLARSLAAAEGPRAAERYRELLSTLKPSGEALIFARVHHAGLEVLADRKGALDSYAKILASGHRPEFEANLRQRMAWCMYRAEKPQDAEKELTAAIQRYPREALLHNDLAWVLTDLGRQADALRHLAESTESSVKDQDLAVEAVIRWRTDERDLAKTLFEQAAREDPVWMVPRWVEYNFTRSTASTLRELQAAELARRSGKDRRAPPVAGGARPPAPRQ
jgi:predicted Zn-dependent protease